MKRTFVLIQVLMLLGLYALRTLPLIQEFSVGKGLLKGSLEFTVAVIVIYGNVWLINRILNQGRSKWLYSLFLFGLLLFGAIFQVLGYWILRHLLNEPELENTLQLLIFSFVICMVYVIFSTPIKYAFDYFKLKERQQSIENEKLQSELKYLKLQINPHFLFNTLNNLLALAKQQSPQTPQVVEGLAFLMRYMMEESNNERVLLSAEIEFLNAYLNLERIRVPQIDIALDVEGEPMGVQVPPLLFLPLVENAIKHGVHKSAADNYIYVDFDITAKSIICKVMNRNRAQNQNTSSGWGLRNLQKRLQLLYGEAAKLDYGTNEHGEYVATLTIPI